MRISKFVAASVALALGGLGTAAQASTCDLTSLNLNGTCTVNGAIFQEGAFDLGAGTGVFPSFVQVTGNDEVKDAYNTTVNNVLDNGSAANFNRAIQLQNVSLVNEFGGLFYEFFLDINQNQGSANEFLSLNDVQLFTSTVANQSVTTFNVDGTVAFSPGTLRYRMDGGSVTDVLLEFGIHPGSATADLRLLVPLSAFAGAIGTDFVYLYSKFGDYTWTQAGQTVAGGTNNDGFEEWALRTGTATNTCPPGFVGTPPDCTTTDVPEPGTLALLGLGLLGLGVARRNRV